MAESNLTRDTLSEYIADAILPVTVLVGSLSIVGILGNCLVLYFYIAKYSVCNFRYFVICLALVDLYSCTINLPLEIYVHRHWFNFSSTFNWLCILKKGSSGYVICVSACLLLLISVDRYLKICRPLGKQLQPNRALQLCIVIMAGFFLLYTPSVVIFGKGSYNVTYEGQTLVTHTCQRSDITRDEPWINVFLILVFSIPTSVSTVLNTVLYSFVVRVLLLKIKCSNNTKTHFPQPSSEFRQGETCQNTDTSHVKETPFNVEDQQPTDKEVESFNGTADKDPNRRQKNHSEQISKTVGTRRKIVNKTIIMLIVTILFDVTIVIYFIMSVPFFTNESIFKLATKGFAGIIFFIWRLYFINHVINPFVYGFFDTRFRNFLKDIVHRKGTSDAT